MIKILGHKFELDLSNNFIDDRELNPDRDLGRLHHLLKKISIDIQVKDWFETLLHECIHSLCDQFRIDLDEKDVNRMSEGLYCLLMDNNWLKDDIERLIFEREKQPKIKDIANLMRP